MKNKISLLGLTALLIFYGCKKEKGPEGIQLDVPFYATLNNTYILKDERLDTASGNIFKTSLFLKCTEIYDNRCFVGEGFSGCCPSSTGGFAKVYTQIYEDHPDSTYVGAIIGCTNGQEWDTTNSNTPHFIRNGYKIFFLKLDPWENKAASKEDYKVKYVIKRN